MGDVSLDDAGVQRVMPLPADVKRSTEIHERRFSWLTRLRWCRKCT
jgi:hypothetical protein